MITISNLDNSFKLYGLTEEVINDPEKEFISEETGEEIIIQKDKNNKVIGFEKLNLFANRESSAIPVTTYEKAVAARFRTRMTQIARIFTDMRASASSAQSVFYRNPFEFITLYLEKFNSRSNYS